MRIDRKTWRAGRGWVFAEELKPFERDFSTPKSYPSVRSYCPDAQIIRHIHERRSLRRKMWMIQIHSQNSKSSAPGYCFEVLIPDRGATVLCSLVTRGRLAALRRAAVLVATASSSIRRCWARAEKIASSSRSRFPCSKRRRLALRHSQMVTADKQGSDIELRYSHRRDGERRSAKDPADHILCASRRSGRDLSKDIRPVSDLFEMDAVLQEPAPCFRQETRPKGHAIRRQIKTQSTLQLLPDGQRRTQQRRMDASLVNSGDFHGEPTLEFTQRKNRAFFGRVAFSSFRIAESCARKDVNRSHHGADQPLNVTAEAWRRRRTVDELDPVFTAGRLQRSRMKFRAVVAMQDGRQSCNRPWMLNATLL